MSVEMGLIVGLALVSYMVIRLKQDFKDSQTMEERAGSVLSIFFIIGLEWTAYGFATANNYTNAKNSYLIALIITILVFVALMILLIKNYWDETRESDELPGITP